MNENTIKYLTLPLTFTKSGWKFSQVERFGDWAVYEKQKGERIKSWELIKILRHDGREFVGQFFPPSEMYPSSSQWGNLGWTFTSKKQALKKFNEQIKLYYNS